MAFDPDIRLPEAYIVNELLSLDGSKFSTSRNHLIWGRDLLATAPSDYVRFYLSYIRPETWKNNFTLSEFHEVIERELIGHWQSWLDRVFDCSSSVFNNHMPEPGAWTAAHRRYFERLMRQFDDARASYQPDDFSPQRICRIAVEIVREAERFRADQEHLRALPECYDQFRTAFAIQMLTAKMLAAMLAPIMPDFADKLWRCLMSDQPMLWNDAAKFLPGKTKVTPPTERFFVALSLDDLTIAVQSKAA